MKTFTLLVALALTAATSAHAQTAAKQPTYPLLAVNSDPQLEQARQQVIREQQARRQEVAAQPARKHALRKRPRVQYAYRAPIVVTSNSPAPANRP